MVSTTRISKEVEHALAFASTEFIAPNFFLATRLDYSAVGYLSPFAYPPMEAKLNQGRASNRGCRYSARLPISRSYQDAIDVVEAFHAHKPPPTQEALEEMEANARQARQSTPQSEIEADMQS